MKEGIKVGDLVTGTKGTWLEDGMARVIKIEKNDVTIKITKIEGTYATVGQISTDWDLSWLVKVEENKDVEDKSVIVDEIEVGDTVKFREWDDMESEFGLSDSKNIKCKCGFVRDMIGLCGSTFIVTKVNGCRLDGSDCRFSVSKDMVKKVIKVEKIEEAEIHKTKVIKFKAIIKDRKTVVKIQNGASGVTRCIVDAEMNEYEGIRIALARAFKVEPFPEKIETICEKKIEDFKVGDRVEVVSDINSFSQEVKIGAKGTVKGVFDTSLSISFDILEGRIQVAFGYTGGLNSLEVIGTSIEIYTDEELLAEITNRMFVKK